MTLIFFVTWFAPVAQQLARVQRRAASHDLAPIAWGNYLVNADFWEKTLQNWQSEFLAVGTMVVFTIYLRQRGSPESKPVGAPHDETGSSGLDALRAAPRLQDDGRATRSRMAGAPRAPVRTARERGDRCPLPAAVRRPRVPDRRRARPAELRRDHLRPQLGHGRLLRSRARAAVRPAAHVRRVPSRRQRARRARRRQRDSTTARRCSRAAAARLGDIGTIAVGTRTSARTTLGLQDALPAGAGRRRRLARGGPAPRQVGPRARADDDRLRHGRRRHGRHAPRGCVPGVTMRELQEDIEHELSIRGSRCPSFPTHIFSWLGPRLGRRHRHGADRRGRVRDVRLRRRPQRLLLRFRPHGRRRRAAGRATSTPTP